jgi:hypothetical protein
MVVNEKPTAFLQGEIHPFATRQANPRNTCPLGDGNTSIPERRASRNSFKKADITNVQPSDGHFPRRTGKADRMLLSAGGRGGNRCPVLEA